MGTMQYANISILHPQVERIGKKSTGGEHSGFSGDELAFVIANP